MDVRSLNLGMRSYKSNHSNQMRIPYGWRLSKYGYHMVNPVQRDVIKKIYSMRKSGLNLQEIADYLNSNDFPTSRNGKWHCTTVKKIIDQNSRSFS